jgi:hypothetical protein
MGLFKIAYVQGVGTGLEALGHVGWANEKIAGEVYSHVADQYDGPEVLESAPALEETLKVAKLIVSVHETLAPKGFGADASTAALRKHAAARDLESQAYTHAAALMQKVADGLIMTGGQHTNHPESATDSIAKLDQHNRPQGSYVVGVGNTDMHVPTEALIGKEQPHPKTQTNTPHPSNSVTDAMKGAALKQAGAIDAVKGVAEKGVNAVKGVAEKGLNAAKGVGDAASKAYQGMSAPAHAGLMGGLGGAGLGAGIGAMTADENPGQGALMGAGIGGLAGAGAGYGGLQALLSSSAGQGALAGMPQGRGGDYAAAGEALKQYLSQLPGVSHVQDAMANRAASEESMLNKFNSDRSAEAVKQADAGSLTDSKKNTPEDAAKHDSIAKLDQKNRPRGKVRRARRSLRARLEGRGSAGARPEAREAARREGRYARHHARARDQERGVHARGERLRPALQQDGRRRRSVPACAAESGREDRPRAVDDRSLPERAPGIPESPLRRRLTPHPFFTQ